MVRFENEDSKKGDKEQFLLIAFVTSLGGLLSLVA